MFHAKLGVLRAQPLEFLVVVLAQVAASLVGLPGALNPVAQRALVHPEVACDLCDRLPGLFDDPDSTLTELLVVLLPLLWHLDPYCRCLYDPGEPQNVLSDLLGINANSIGQVIAKTRQLLTARARTIPATTLRLSTTTALRDFLAGDRALPARTQVPELLSDPALIGMAGADLATMTERVRHVLEARNERHRHRRRDGERLPGARGGVFIQKITHDERVLATVLYLRRLCTQDALAELFHVSRRTIGDVVREVGPVLAQNGYASMLAPPRFPSAPAVLGCLARGKDTTRSPS